MGAYATINDMQEYHRSLVTYSVTLTWGFRNSWERDTNHVDDVQTMPPVELQLMTSWGSLKK